MAFNITRKDAELKSTLFYVSAVVFNTACLKLDWQMSLQVIHKFCKGSAKPSLSLH